jgi:hypothetical protein
MSRTDAARASAILEKRRQPFACFKEAGGTGSEEQRKDRAIARGRLSGGKRRKEKKGLGGRRKPLIRLNSAKEIQGFPLLDFGRALLDEAQIWLRHREPLQGGDRSPSFGGPWRPWRVLGRRA